MRCGGGRCGGGCGSAAPGGFGGGCGYGGYPFAPPFGFPPPPFGFDPFGGCAPSYASYAGLYPWFGGGSCAGAGCFGQRFPLPPIPTAMLPPLALGQPPAYYAARAAAGSPGPARRRQSPYANVILPPIGMPRRPRRPW